MTDARGRAVEQFIMNSDMNIINDGAPTRVSYNAETATDLSLCSTGVEADLQWSIDSSPGDSDHCPIFIRYEVRSMTGSCEEAIKDVYERIEKASLEAIPVGRWNKYFPKPWWSEELKLSKMHRERQYQRYRRNKTYENMIAWKKS